MIYGYKELYNSADWEEIVGSTKWKPGRSAYELAQKWHDHNLPSRVTQALSSSTDVCFAGLKPDCLFVEHPTFLDTFKAPSCTDVLAHCRNRMGDRVIIGVEGKATEPFGDRIAAWIAAGTPAPLPTHVQRLTYVNTMLGVEFSTESNIRYQLVHRTAAIVHEAELRSAIAAIVLVHSFSAEPAGNWSDFQAFLTHMDVPPIEKGQVSRCIHLGPRKDVPTYFMWIEDEPIGAAS